jgi:hypothetical protein
MYSNKVRDLYTSPSITRVIKTIRMGWAGNVACMAKRCTYRVLVGKNLRTKDHLRNLGVDWRIILKFVFKKWDRVMDWIDLGQDGDRQQFSWKEVINMLVAEQMGNFSTISETMSFSRRILFQRIGFFLALEYSWTDYEFSNFDIRPVDRCLS